MSEATLSTWDVAQRAGISDGALREWLKRGLVATSVARATGRARPPIRWTEEDCARVVAYASGHPMPGRAERRPTFDDAIAAREEKIRVLQRELEDLRRARPILEEPLQSKACR